MYCIKQKDFGSSTLVRLQNNITGAYVQVLPGYGGALQQIGLPAGDQLHPLLWTNDDPSSWEHEAVPWYKGAWLAPFPDRVAKGSYTFNQKEYKLPLNQLAEGHALHGFVNNLAMEIVSSYSDDEAAELTLRLQYAGDYEGYPFPFIAEHKYLLSALGLHVTSSIKNAGCDIMPFGMGWHPYFAVDINSVNSLLKVEASGICPVDESNIPTGQVEARNPFSSFTPVNFRNDKEMLFVAFALENSKPEIVTVLRDAVRQIEISVKQQNHHMGYNYLQVFTMDGLGGIAIEPFTCMSNAFNNGNGLWVLQPGQLISTSYGVQVHAFT